MGKILVGVKRVVDYSVRVRPTSDGTGVMTEGAKMSVNPFDEIALEEAIRMREAGHADEVIAISVGPADAQNQLRSALAMGADKAILVQTPDSSPLSPLTTARALLKLAERIAPMLIILGKQAIDDDHGQTGQMLAALWHRPQATYASRVELVGTVARVTREVDSGLETVEIDLPGVITVDLRLNEPRYIKLPDIMKAKRKPLDVIALAELGIEEAAGTPRTVRFFTPPTRAKGVMVKSVDELVTAMKARGVLG